MRTRPAPERGLIQGGTNPDACGSCAIGLHQCDGFHPVLLSNDEIGRSTKPCGCGCASIDGWPSDENTPAPDNDWLPDPELPGRFVPPPDTALPDDPQEYW